MNVLTQYITLEPAPARGVSWTQEAIKRASDLWKNGFKAEVIGSVFGVSKSAITGIARRHPDLFPARQKHGRKRHALLALESSKPASVVPPAKPNWNTGIFTHKSREGMSLDAKRKISHEEAKEHARLIITDAAKTEYDEARMPFAKELQDLVSCECRWPLNSGGPFLFCAAVTDNASYCDHHEMRSKPIRKGGDE
jgi:GcrA cell cycle regulator